MAAGPFTDGLGRIGRIPLGCEETEFSIRVRRAVPGAEVLYVPAAEVMHHVACDRGTWRYFASRCWAEGLSKAIVARLVGRGDGLSSERSYVTRTPPHGMAAGIAAAAHGDVSGLGRAAALTAGVTTAGYLKGRLTARQSGSRRSPRRVTARSLGWSPAPCQRRSGADSKHLPPTPLHDPRPPCSGVDVEHTMCRLARRDTRWR